MAGPAGKLGSVLDRADHPLLFAFALVLMLVPMMAMVQALFAYLGWSGPASLFKHP